MATDLLSNEWDVISELLPANWRELAMQTRAIRRQRGDLQDPQVLLQVLLMHISTGLSLKQAAARATAQGLAKITPVALHKRLKSSAQWLRELACHMFQQSRCLTLPSFFPPGRRLRAVDATTVEEPGATGTDWRVHYSLTLPQLECDHYQVTDASIGETLINFPILPGDILLGDRAYCHREAVAHVMKQGGDVIVRLNSNSFPLLCSDDYTPFDLLWHLRQLRGRQTREWKVGFEADKTLWRARLCVVRKSAAAAERAKRHLNREAKRKGRKVSPKALEAAEYIFVLTTLPAEEITTAQVLELYRARWQIELCFKRLKSLLRLGHVPKRGDLSARAFIEGKLLTALWIQRLAEQARFFSPWGFDLAAS